MKRALSVLLCLVLMLSLMGASAPMETKKDGEETKICAMCEKLGCEDQADGTTVHKEGCLCTHPVKPAQAGEKTGTEGSKEAAQGALLPESQLKEEKPETCLCTCPVCAAMGKEPEVKKTAEGQKDSVDEVPGMSMSGPDIIDESYGGDPANNVPIEQNGTGTGEPGAPEAGDPAGTGGEGQTGTPDGSVQTGEVQDGENLPDGDPQDGEALPAGDPAGNQQDGEDQTAGGQTGEDQSGGSQDGVIVPGNNSLAPEDNGLNGSEMDELDGGLLLGAPSPTALEGTDFAVSGGTKGADYTYKDGVLTISTGTPITVSMAGSTASTVDQIKAAPGVTVNLTVSGLTVTASGPVLDLSQAAGANLTYSGANVLTADSGNAILVPSSGTLYISGTGMLTVTGSTAAFSGAPNFGSAVHITLDSAGKPVEWTGNPKGDWSQWASVSIQPMTVTGIGITPKEAESKQLGQVQFHAALYVNYSSASAPQALDVTDTALWYAENSTPAADVMTKGLLYVPATESSNELTVRVRYTAGTEFTDTAHVIVHLPATKVTLDWTGGAYSLYVGQTHTFQATVEPKYSLDSLVWKSEDSSIVAVDQNGTITAKKVGKTEITVQAGSVSTTLKVEVLPRDFTITFDPNGGSCNTKTMKTKADGTLESLPTATRSGMYFAHWYTAKTGGQRVSLKTVFNEDTTLYAHWSTNPVTGDESNAGLWAALLGVSAVALCAGGVYFFRKSRKKGGGTEK